MLKKLFIFTIALLSLKYVENICANETQSYSLQEGHSAAQRLNFQHNLFKPHFIKAFQSASSIIQTKSATVVDFGCGTSSSYEDIQNIIGESGHYIGIDASEKQIAFNKSNYKNAVYIIGNENTKNVENALANADIIYLRFVAMHQKNPEAFIKKIYTLAKSKAVIIMQEPEETVQRKVQMVRQYPFAGALCDIKSKVGSRLGIDYSFAAKNMESFFKNLNPQVIHHSAEYIQVPMPQAKQLFEYTVREMHTKDSKILTASELAHYLELTAKLPSDSNQYWIFDLFHTVVVQKR